MTSQIDFITGLSLDHESEKSQRFILYSKYPNKFNTGDVNTVLQWNCAKSRKNNRNNDGIIDDGLYVSNTGPLTYDIQKPYQLNYQRTIDMQAIPKVSKKLLEISIREVKIHGETASNTININSVAILYKEKLICKISSPFNRKLYKLLINSATGNSNNLSIRVQTRDNCFSILPLPLPTRCVKDRKLEIDFSINNSDGLMFSGTLICTITLSLHNNSDEQNINNKSLYLYKLTNDPNDPQNSLSLMRRPKIIDKKSVDYFLLEDPALKLNDSDIEILNVNKSEKIPPPNIVILEQSRFSFWDIAFSNWIQAKRPLRPSSPTNALKIRGGRDEILTITILRGVELPVREDSSTVQPLIQIQWGNTIHCTNVVDGSTPVWQQTIHFDIPKGEATEFGIKLSLFDQHPIWGLQWLGEATIPLDFYSNYQEIERWIGLSSLYSPVHRFGYVQNNNSINTHTTRIYVLLKMKRLNNEETRDIDSLNVLSKTIQRCMATPYKISGIENSDDAAKLAMLLTPLPTRYGPLNPRQALKLNKVDYYGRAALLATLLQGLGIDTYVVIGTSQARKWAAFVLSINSNKTNSEIHIWDPENGADQYSLVDSRCSLIKIIRLINHQNIWKNLQKTTVLSNLKFNLKNSKDWQPLGVINETLTAAPTLRRDSQILDLEIPTDTIDDNTWMEIENDLKDKLSLWRSKMGFTTVFNRHAASILRKYINNLSKNIDAQSPSDKNIMKQLYRAYNIQGFILNLRYMPRDELINLFLSTKIQEITGAIEFALVCNVQHYVGKTLSLWLAVAVLRSRN